LAPFQNEFKEIVILHKQLVNRVEEGVLEAIFLPNLKRSQRKKTGIDSIKSDGLSTQLKFEKAENPFESGRFRK